MGAAIARRLVASGPLLGYDLDTAKKADARALGVEVVDSLEAFRSCEAVVLSLPSPAASRAVAAQLREVAPPGTILIETSTVNPHDMHRLAADLTGTGVRLVEAAILSGVGGMAQGAAILLTGGSEQDLADARGILERMSSRIIPFGPLGAGMAAKVINNGVAHAVMVVLCEAVELAEANGISLDAISELLADPEAGLMRPLTHRVMERVASGAYDGGMPTEAARKDSTLVLELAQHTRTPLYATQAAHTVYELALAQGLARKDYASIASLWPNLSRHGAPE
jgi:3-hydroxyisobutyrate dehydrogenase-like beta-hydroxyacid dehydrogenase